MSELKHKYIKLGDNPTKEEIKKEIQRLKNLRVEYKNKDHGKKVILNSIYGALGFSGFIDYNRDVAQSITKESEMFIKYTINAFNYFFRNIFPKLDKVHQKMGIRKVGLIDFDVVNYADTDSAFIMADKLLDRIEYDKDFVTFVIDLDNLVMKSYVKKICDIYIHNHHGFMKKKDGSDSMKLVMDQICNRVLWKAKKIYVKSVIWDKGKSYDSFEEIQARGGETRSSAFPNYVREKHKMILDFFMKRGNSLDIEELTSMLKKVKDEMKTLPIEQICKAERVGDYEKFVIQHVNNIEFGSGAKPHYKGAGLYNHLLEKHGLKGKYDMIKTGAKVCFYYTDKCPIEAFSFFYGEYPIEIAPNVNYDIQFSKNILTPVNNLLSVMKIKPLDINLISLPSIF